MDVLRLPPGQAYRRAPLTSTERDQIGQTIRLQIVAGCRLWLRPLVKVIGRAHNSLVEYETLVEGVAHRPTVRAARPAAETLASNEQTPVGPATGTSPALGPSAVIGLQRTAGNAAVAALIQRRATLAEEQEPSSVRDVVGKGGGEALDPTVRRDMEVRLGGADLSGVRIHTGAAAARSAAHVSALAYTVGDEVVFGAGAPALESDEGRRMLAHELTHVIQQREGPVSGTPAPGGISISDPSDMFEQAAEANAEQAMSVQMTPPSVTESLIRIQVNKRKSLVCRLWALTGLPA